MRRWPFRAAALVVAAFWIAALFSSYGTATYGYGTPHLTRDEPGRFLAEWRWLGPLGGNVAWYANLLLLWIMVRLVRGQSAGVKLPLVAGALALTAFLPGFVYDFEQDGKFHLTVVYGPAVWVWVSAFALPAAIGLFLRDKAERS